LSAENDKSRKNPYLWLVPKILRLGIKASSLLFSLGLFDFGFAEDTPARQNASKLAFTLAYSYL
ncbi:MAG: hypothetical protein K2I32_07670, partial [Alistipes sp.]|nr:hypothetical protein [Alistipes sp.]